MNITAKIINNPLVLLYINKGNDFLAARGTIQLGYEHAKIVSERSRYLLEELGYSDREADLAEVAGFLHDIGNLANRYDHGRTGALICYKLLTQLKMPLEDILTVMSAVGNHEETTGYAVNNTAAAVIISDKTDLHQDRVRKKDFSQFTGRDRVNYAVTESVLEVCKKSRSIILEIKINQSICSVMEYFEIFLTKMLMCQRAAGALNSNFKLIINDVRLL
ncbi:MAG: HD domain-containing protein [Bacillota bacterium]|nr:HD domain-containing protein [Bacillota bacterium]